MSDLGTSEPGAFGQILRWHREQSGWDQRRVAAVIGAAATAVDDFERGLAVPSTKQWKCYKAAVHRGLHAYGEHYHAAAADFERRKRARRDAAPSVQVTTDKVTVNYGDKLVETPIHHPEESAAMPPTKNPPPPAVTPPTDREKLHATIAEIADLACSAIPGLVSFSIDVDADGAVAVAYNMRETRVVETRGEMSLPKPKK